MNTNIRIAIAEAIGTMVLVIGGPGTAIFATGLFGADPGALNVGTLGVSIAFGLALLAMAYTIGNISGCHINPAVTIGLLVLGKIDAAAAAVYIAAQIVGGIIGALFIYLVVMGGPDGSLDRVQAAGFASNGYDTHSPGLFNLASVAATEIVLTAVFVMIVVARAVGPSRRGSPGSASASPSRSSTSSRSRSRTPRSTRPARSPPPSSRVTGRSVRSGPSSCSRSSERSSAGRSGAISSSRKRPRVASSTPTSDRPLPAVRDQRSRDQERDPDRPVVGVLTADLGEAERGVERHRRRVRRVDVHLARHPGRSSGPGVVEHRLVQRPAGSPALRTGVDGDAVDVAMVVVALLEPPVVGRGVVGTGSQHQHEPLRAGPRGRSRPPPGSRPPRSPPTGHGRVRRPRARGPG